jgi:hypothetical protein
VQPWPLAVASNSDQRREAPKGPPVLIAEGRPKPPLGIELAHILWATEGGCHPHVPRLSQNAPRGYEDNARPSEDARHRLHRSSASTTFGGAVTATRDARLRNGARAFGLRGGSEARSCQHMTGDDRGRFLKTWSNDGLAGVIASKRGLKSFAPEADIGCEG